MFDLLEILHYPTYENVIHHMQNICDPLKTTKISDSCAETVESRKQIKKSASGCGYISAFHFVTLKGGMNLISHNVLKRFTSTVEQRYICFTNISDFFSKSFLLLSHIGLTHEMNSIVKKRKKCLIC
jgi:hypothetical protein